METAIDAIGLGRSHVFLLFCVSLIWAGGKQHSCKQKQQMQELWVHSRQPPDEDLSTMNNSSAAKTFRKVKRC
jgi:hypothetical protein